MLTAWQMLAVSFLVPETEFWCSPPGLQTPLGKHVNWTSAANEHDDSPDDCKMFDLDYNISTLVLEVNQSKVTACTRWDYARNVYPESVVSEFNLVSTFDY